MSKAQRTVSSPTREGQIRDRWKRIGTIAHRAGSDDTSSESDLDTTVDPDERAKLIERKRSQKQEREKYAKVSIPLGKRINRSTSTSCRVSPSPDALVPV